MNMTNILPVPEGSDVSVYNVLSYVSYIAQNECKREQISIVYRTPDGKKRVHTTEPRMEIYFVKPEYREEFSTSREYFPMDHIIPKMTHPRYVLNTIIDEANKCDLPVTRRFMDKFWTRYNGSNRSNRAKKEIHKWPYVLMSDMDVESYYWTHIGYHYNLDHSHIINKCFADIENDVYGLSSMQMSDDQDPVNACTLIFDTDDSVLKPGQAKFTSITHLLRNHKRYPQQKEFEENLDQFVKLCHKHFDHQTIIKKDKKEIIDTVADYKIVFHDTEQDLLIAVFDTINSRKPDVCEFWNMPYDMPKMRNRMDILGIDPRYHMCDRELFPEDILQIDFHMDDRPIDIANRNSYIRLSSTTLYMDQMQNYASIRKGFKAYGSNSLDNIANIELGMGKWKFRDGVDVKNACIFDYLNFVLYNIRDVWCQVLIDIVTNDTMSIIYDMNQMNCAAQFLAKQTKYQRQIYYVEYLRRGYVPGNNINVDYLNYNDENEQERAVEAKRKQALREALDKSGMTPDEIQELMNDPNDIDEMLSAFGIDIDEDSTAEEASLNDIAKAELDAELDKVKVQYEDTMHRKLPLSGGLVGHPDHNTANGVELIPGHRSKHIFKEVLDADYSSEYPWVKYTRSVTRSTQIGRLVIPNKVSDMQFKLPLGQEKRDVDRRQYIPGGEFTSDFISQDFLMFGEVWFNLPNVQKCNDMINEKLGLTKTEDEVE